MGAIGTIEVSGDSTKGLLTITQKSNTDGKIGLSVDDTVMNTRLEELSAENVNRIYDMARNTVFLNEVPDVVPAQSALTLDLPFITSKSAAVLKGYSVRFSAGNYTKEVLYGERMLEIDIPDTGVQDMQYVISLVHDNTAEVIKRGVIRVALPVGIASSSDGAETTAERSVSWNTALTRNEIHMSDVTLQGPYLHLFVPEQDLYRGRLRNVTSDGFTIPMTAADETVEIDGVSHRFLTSPELNGDTVSNITLHYVSD